MSQGGLPGVVFDTMILYQATANLAGPAAELLRQLEAGRFVLYVSDKILDEARDVLSRPKLRAKNPRVTDETVRETFDLLDRLARTVSNVPSLFSLPRDPDDEPYLNLAIAARRLSGDLGQGPARPHAGCEFPCPISAADHLESCGLAPNLDATTPAAAVSLAADAVRDPDASRCWPDA